MENKFKEKLVILRKEHKMSQEVLADKLFVSRQTISKWENGDTTPDLDNIIKLASFFNISLDELVYDITPIQESFVDGKENSEFNETKKQYSIDYENLFNRYWWLLIPLGGGIITIFEIIFNR